jgi:hypothetical protein
MMLVSPYLLAVLLAQGSGSCNSQPRTYIKCDSPITCSVSYSADFVAVELHAAEECEVEIWTGFEPQWALLDGERVKKGWSCPREDTVAFQAQAGVLMWEFGTGPIPLRGPGPPVTVEIDGRKAGQLGTTYSARGLEARGEVEAPFAMYRVALTRGSRVVTKTRQPKLRIADTELREWEEVLAGTGRQGLRAEENVLVSGKAALRLSWQGDFRQPPVRQVLLETVAHASELTPVDPPALEAAGVIIIEAEDFSREGGGGAAQVSRGEHADQHGGASIYSFGVDEHWLEWTFGVPADGKYILYARTATQEEFSLRTLRIDRDVPFPEAELLRFPGTGGWARDDPKQWVYTILAGADGRPALELSAGEHRLRLQTRAERHLNVDFLALVPTE